jgi:copper chaperone NosL
MLEEKMMWPKKNMFCNSPTVNMFLLCMEMLFVGCTSSEVKPVDIFAEDNCSQCRMTVSDERFASEIITDAGDVLKFDDLGCLLKYRSQHREQKIAATYIKDYETKQWLAYERAIIVETDIETPMGSGKIAFTDSMRAREFQKEHPANKSMSDAGCSGSCCAE